MSELMGPGDSSSARHAKLLLAAALDRPPDGLTWRGYLVQLLHIASSIEHSLMVQYLFAAYSLGGDMVKDQRDREMVTRWRNLIVSVAKEEMGHLLTVQNVLCLLGAPVELARENHPWDRDFYPFPFKLEKLTLKSVSRYFSAEAPEEFVSHFRSIFSEAHNLDTFGASDDDAVHRIGLLYKEIDRVIRNPDLIPDSDFHEDSVRFQASWDDWGRRYNDKPAKLKEGVQSLLNEFYMQPLTEAAFSTLFTEMVLPKLREFEDEPTRADVIIARVRSRSQAREALKKISDQGESADKESGSHYVRFLSIIKDFTDAKNRNGEGWEPTHRVVEDPHTRLLNEKRNESESTIEWPASEKWANLFNLRYRMLLTYLSHSFQLARDGSQASLRGAVNHKVFGEMYNLKAIAGILVRLPLKSKEDPSRAGPPFQMPYTLALPIDAIDRWRLHRDLVAGALELNAELLELGSDEPEELSLLHTIKHLDENSAEWIEHVIAGLGRGRPSP